MQSFTYHHQQSEVPSSLLGRAVFQPWAWQKSSLPSPGSFFIWKERNGKWQKNPNQTKQETFAHCTAQCCNYYCVDTSTIHTTGTTSPEGRTLECSTVEGRAASVPAWWLLSLGTYPPAHPSPGTAAASCRTGTETAELFSQPRTHLFVCTLLWACNTNSCSLSLKKEATIQPNKRPKLHLVNIKFSKYG